MKIVTPIHGETLIDNDDQLWLPYDLEQAQIVPAGLRKLSACYPTLHAGREPFTLDFSKIKRLHILNGMGVSLGDSVIGLNALFWLKQQYPQIQLILYRSRYAPANVTQLYQFTPHFIDSIHYFSLPLTELTKAEVVIDLADILFWSSFAALPMIDFFLWGLGIDPDSVPASAKTNAWLNTFNLPSISECWLQIPYILFCPEASSQLRSIPPDSALQLIERIWQRYHLPLVGFQSFEHPHYHDVSLLSPTTAHYLAWVKQAQLLVSTDTSAIHLAAGFNIPTLALFISIDPVLRVRDYPTCTAIDLSTPELKGIHASDDRAILAIAAKQWQKLVNQTTLAWPSIH